MGKRFSDWLLDELEGKNWSSTTLARMAGVGPGSISRILNEQRKPGPDLCRAIAKALGYSEEFVFRQAGLLSPKQEADQTIYERAGLERLLGLAEQMAPYQVEEVIDYAAWRIEQDKKRVKRKQEIE